MNAVSLAPSSQPLYETTSQTLGVGSLRMLRRTETPAKQPEAPECTEQYSPSRSRW